MRTGWVSTLHEIALMDQKTLATHAPGIHKDRLLEFVSKFQGETIGLHLVLPGSARDTGRPSTRHHPRDTTTPQATPLAAASAQQAARADSGWKQWRSWDN